MFVAVIVERLILIEYQGLVAKSKQTCLIFVSRDDGLFEIGALAPLRRGTFVSAKVPKTTAPHTTPSGFPVLLGTHGIHNNSHSLRSCSNRL